MCVLECHSIFASCLKYRIVAPYFGFRQFDKIYIMSFYIECLWLNLAKRIDREKWRAILDFSLHMYYSVWCSAGWLSGWLAGWLTWPHVHLWIIYLKISMWYATKYRILYFIFNLCCSLTLGGFVVDRCRWKERNKQTRKRIFVIIIIHMRAASFFAFIFDVVSAVRLSYKYLAHRSNEDKQSNRTRPESKSTPQMNI